MKGCGFIHGFFQVQGFNAVILRLKVQMKPEPGNA